MHNQLLWHLPSDDASRGFKGLKSYKAYNVLMCSRIAKH